MTRADPAGISAVRAFFGIRKRPPRCGCPACDPEEAQTRALIGMPRLHPERVTRGLPRRQERRLASLEAKLWPAGEWTAITTDVRGEEGQS